MKIRNVKIAFSVLFFLILMSSYRVESVQNMHFYASDSKKFVWFRVYKVGSTTTLNLLRQHVADLSNITKTSAKTFANREKYKDYFKFAFVRNPWARIVSCFFGKVVAKNGNYYKECFDKDFEFFVNFVSKQDLRTAEKHIRLQTEMIPLKELNFIGKLENFSNDLRYVCDTLGIPSEEIQQRNQTTHAPYTEYYSLKTKKIIAKKYKADIEAFGYKFGDEK